MLKYENNGEDSNHMNDDNPIKRGKREKRTRLLSPKSMSPASNKDTISMHENENIKVKNERVEKNFLPK